LSLDAEQALAPLRGGASRCAPGGITLIAAVLAVAACGNPAPAPSGLPPAAASDAAAVSLPMAPATAAQTLKETGSSLMTPLFARWAPADHARFSQGTLRTTSSSSGTGIKSAAAGTIKAALASFTNTPASEAISLVNGAGALSYPIVNYEYAIVNTSQTSADRARDLRAFLSWAIISGAAQLARVNFQPLPSSVVTLSGALIATIKG
jgi:ABC-type phosphate transport system substrate-binding protein